MKRYKIFESSLNLKEIEKILQDNINLNSCSYKETSNSIMYIKKPTKFDMDEAYFDIIYYNNMVLLKFEVKIVVSSSDPFYKQKIDAGIRDIKSKKFKLDTSVDSVEEAFKEIKKFKQKIKNTKWEK